MPNECPFKEQVLLEVEEAKKRKKEEKEERRKRAKVAAINGGATKKVRKWLGGSGYQLGSTGSQTIAEVKQVF